MAKSNLSQSICARLSERILHWDFLPGHRFTEEELCDEFKVSRSPVREALNTLAENGLIEKRPGRGYSVKLLDVEEVNELYDVRLALESYAVELIFRNGADEKRLRELQAFWSDTSARLSDSANAVAAADEEFHETLVALTNNKTLLASLEEIDRRIHFVRLADITNEERVRETCTQHVEILEAIAEEDEPRARAALRTNIEGGRCCVDHAIRDALAHAYRTRE